ncbi:uncharacterized protein LOC118644181, partial [Monomorium pharaonis]|uniref:uncharacterized protein LOC118644181 n=1 Tax=Monomorium pharaonis TaxID=307658 RepID=UPI001746DDBB
YHLYFVIVSCSRVGRNCHFYLIEELTQRHDATRLSPRRRRLIKSLALIVAHDSRWIIGEWQGCTPCTSGCKRRRAVKCVRPVGRGEQDLDVIEDSYCQGPKPRESASCEASERRRRREDRGAERRRRGPTSARSSTLTRQNDFVRAARVPAKTALSGAVVEDRHPGDLPTRPRQTGDPSNRSCFTGTGYVNALPRETTGLISADTRRDRSQIDKRSGNTLNDKKKNTSKLEKGRMVVDKEDIRNLTLTIILERDERNAVMNFPKDFEPRPPENSTEFTLLGVDALRYIQRIQEEARASTSASIFRGRRACDAR